MEESDLWPIRILDRLKEKQFLEPLQQCFQSGVILTTDYSGIGTAEEATRHLCVVAALAEEAQGSPMTHELEEIVGQRLFVQRCGDKDAACREILLTHSGASCCVHGDIGERCDRLIWEDVSDQIKKIRASSVVKLSTSPKAFAAAVFNQLMEQDLEHVSSFCYRHQKKCPVHPVHPHPILSPVQLREGSSLTGDSAPSHLQAHPISKANSPATKHVRHIESSSSRAQAARLQV